MIHVPTTWLHKVCNIFVKTYHGENNVLAELNKTTEKKKKKKKIGMQQRSIS